MYTYNIYIHSYIYLLLSALPFSGGGSDNRLVAGVTSIYIYIYLSIYLSIYLNICIYIHTYTYMCVYTYAYMCVFIHSEGGGSLTCCSQPCS